jgi:hypothetical protein
MLILSSCPHCATRVPADGSFCDTCGRTLAACPTCNELAKPGEKCLTHGVAAVVRKPAAAGVAAVAAAVPSSAPTVAPPPPRRNASAPVAPPPSAAAPSAAPASAPSLVRPSPPSPIGAGSPAHAAQGTTIQSLARKLRLIAIGGVSLPPLDVDSETVVGRGEGPFAILLDPFHDKGLSRRHCQFRRGPTGTWTVTDLAGRGSTVVSDDGQWSGAPVAQNASQHVEPGRDQIRLGLITFKVEAIA